MIEMEYVEVRDDAFVIRNFYSPEECREAIEVAEGQGFDEAPITTFDGPVMRKDIRDNTRVILDDPALAAQLWERLAPYVPSRIGAWRPCGLNERFRFYRYEGGQRFEWHRDGSFERDEDERSWLTLLIYLNDCFEGGATTLENLDVVPVQGSALIFSHRVLHKGQPVTSGRKYVLRSDVMYRRVQT